MLTKPKFSKFYFPGMISLVVFPLVCVIYLAISSHFFKKYGILHFNTTTEPEFTQQEGGGIEKQVDIKTGRSYNQVLFNGDGTGDVIKQKKIERMVSRLISDKDTVTGVSISFGPHANYASLVRIIDECERSKYDNIEYSFYQGKLYIRYTRFGRDWLIGDLIPPIKDREMPYFSSKNISEMLRKFWPSIIAFIGIIYFTFSKKAFLFST